MCWSNELNICLDFSSLYGTQQNLPQLKRKGDFLPSLQCESKARSVVSVSRASGGARKKKCRWYIAKRPRKGILPARHMESTLGTRKGIHSRIKITLNIMRNVKHINTKCSKTFFCLKDIVNCSSMMTQVPLPSTSPQEKIFLSRVHYSRWRKRKSKFDPHVCVWAKRKESKNSDRKRRFGNSS